MLTSKQRAQLRGMAMTLDTTLHVGKNGITDTVVQQANEELLAHELIKGKVLENALLTAREVCDELAERCGADGVQAIGNKFVLYKANPKEPKIVLVKGK